MEGQKDSFTRPYQKDHTESDSCAWQHEGEEKKK